MKRSYPFCPFHLLLASLCALTLTWFAYPAITSAAETPSNDLGAAWKRAHEVGTYDFVADIEQVLIPRALPSMIGETDQRVDIRIEGDVTLLDHARLRLRFEGAGLDAAPVDLVQEGAETYVLKDGERIPVENPTGVAAPTGDYLGYLAAATNVRAEGERYTFDIDGSRFAAYVRDQLQTEIDRTGTLNGEAVPPGAMLSTSLLLRRMSGHGELWVDADGLPRRQVLDLIIPRTSDEYDAQVHIVVDYQFSESAVGDRRLSQVSESVVQRQGGWPYLPISDLQSPISRTDALFMATSIVLGGACVVYHRRRWLYTVLAISLSLIMVFTPMLQALGIAQFQACQVQAAPIKALADALGMEQPANSDSQDTSRVTDDAVRNVQPTSSNNDSPDLVCGDGDPSEDEDGDGLNDAVENCLGTDPYYEDSDRGMITDTLEVDGFEYGGRTWVSDPFKPDANGDGLVDYGEWPAPVGEAPELADADDWDPDGDGVPNLWDDDNDGDSVPDDLDISPFSHTTYSETFSLLIARGDYDGHQYIELQIQPQNPDHLRYSRSVLDWPHDEKGQIQDLDDSDGDLRLFPLLKVRTDQTPDRTLARRYGVSTFEDDDETYLHIPLAPQGDGGQIVAFYAKVAYGPDAPQTIAWESAELIWIAQMQADRKARGSIVTDATPVATYPGGAFRVAGFQVTKSAAFESAVLGTPSVPDDDRYLFNLAFGVSATFLHNQEPDLQTIVTRFDNPNTDIVETWGVTYTLVSVDSAASSHADAGMADLSTRVPDFLDAHYTSALTPSLVIAYQQEVGVYRLDEAGQYEPGGSLSVNLADVVMNTQRSVKLATYRYDDGWEALSLQETVDMVDEKYDAAEIEQNLEELQEDYPELDEEDLRGVLVLFYSVWFAGQTRIIAVDGQALAPASRSDREVYDDFARAGSGLSTYLVEAGSLGQPGGGLRIGQSQAETWTYQRDEEMKESVIGVIEASGSVLGGGVTGGATGRFFQITGRLVIAILAVKTVYQTARWARGIGAWTGKMKILNNAEYGRRVLGAAGMVIGIAFAWTYFGLSTDFSSPISIKYGVTLAVLSTAFSVILFAISLNPIGAIFAMFFALADVFVILFTGKTIVEHLAEAIYHVNNLTYLDDADFRDFDSGPYGPDLGLTVGNSFLVTAEFVGQIERTSDGDWDDLEDSWATANYRGSIASGNVADRNGGRRCTISGRTNTCYDPVGAEFKFTVAGRDIQLTVESTVHTKTLYEECVFGFCKTKRYDTYLPGDLPKKDRWGPMSFYLGVLPDTLDGLRAWDEIANPDADGDELTDVEEAELGTDPDDWDSDDDGLSDKFEVDHQDDLGCVPLDPDSDDDGLFDGWERRHGTRINAADSDDDGLDDNEEVYHVKTFDYDHPAEPLGAWLGGWVISATQTTTATVFSDPTQADADGDDLNDASERNNCTSPYAYNDSPRLTLDAAPLAASPSGHTAAYVEPGDTVAFTLTLESVGSRAITSTLTLCFPSFIANVSGGDFQGDPPTSRIPPKQVNPTSCAHGGLAWDFSGGHTLQKWESVSTTITAEVSSGVSSSVSGTVAATLPYPVTKENGDIIDQVDVVVDVDDPDVTITAPADGEPFSNGVLLGGGISSYVIGGASSDEMSWVERVSIDLPAGGGTVTANDVSPWAYTWNLPPDGEYTLTARAYDYVGRVGLAVTVAVTVDNTAPTVTLSAADGAIVTGQSDDSTITVTLSGTGSDNLAGLRRIQISIDKRPWREVWFNPTNNAVLSADWSDEWTLPNDDSSQGTHTVAVRTLDRAGNESGALERTIIVDVQLPTAELVHRSYTADPPPHVPTGQSLELHGVANDVGNAPQPSRPVELAGTLDGLTDATIWLGLSDVRENDDGVRVDWLGDFNGDRLADLVVGLPNAGGGAGRVAIVYGRAGDWPVPSDVEALADSYTSLIGGPGDKLGDVLVPAGDVDGDGLADLLLGDPANNRVYVVFGHTSPLGRNVAVTQTARYVTLTAPEGQIGDWLGAAGDVDGDGFDDLLVSAAGVPTTYLMLGQESGLWWEPTDLDFYAAAVIRTSTSGARVTGVGDMDGDQYDEFIVADDNRVYLFTGGDEFMPLAGETLELADAHTTFSSTVTRPSVVALGDVNGTTGELALADFIYADGDTPKIILGDAGRNWTTQPLSDFSPAPSGFLAAPGDVNADGSDDLLVGNSDDDAYLILGGSLDAVQATLTGVETVASAPYAAGADLNSDGSSDLLLVPTAEAAAKLGMYSLDFGDAPRIDPASLQVSRVAGRQVDEDTGGLATDLLIHQSTITVDDDGEADYTSIQAAVDAASGGDTIRVQPGVYAAFTIHDKDDLTVSGIHADAVFVDGAGGAFVAKIQNADGVRLEKLTLRDATDGVVLDDAGVNGYTTPTLKTTLDTLLIYDFSDHAVTMNRVSAVDLTRCTLVGGGSSGAYVAVTGPRDPIMDAAWSTISTDSRAATDDDGELVAGNDGQLYVMPTREETQINVYDPDTDIWSNIPDAPLGYDAGTTVDGGGRIWSLRAHDFGGFASTVRAIAYVSENEIYVGGDFASAPGSPDAAYIARWDGYRWQRVGSGGPDSSVYVLTADGADVYAGGQFGIMRWDGSNWSTLGAVEGREYRYSDVTWKVAVHAIFVNGNDVYVGGNFDQIGGHAAYSVARYDGGWHRLPEGASASQNGVTQSGMYATIMAFAKNNNQLYVGGGGQFIIRGQSGDCSEQFDLTVLNTDDNTFGCVEDRDHWYSNYIQALALYDDNVLVGGKFKHDNGQENDLHIYNPNSDQWEFPGALRAFSPVYALHVSGNEIWAGGAFTKIGSASISRLAYYDGSAWHAIGGGVNGTIHGLAHTGGATYAVGAFTQADGDTIHRVARWDGSAWTRHTHFYWRDGAAWQARVCLDVQLGADSTVTWDEGNYLYALVGGGSNDLYRYTISSNSWTQRADLPGGAGAGGALAWADGAPSGDGVLYALRGGATQSFYRYSPNSNGWATLADAPYAVGAGAGLAWDGGDWLYATFGGNGKQFARYHIPTDRWETLGDGSSATTGDYDTPTAVNAGGGLVSIGHNLYGIPGNDVAEMWRYDPVGLYFDKFSFDQVAFVAPETSADAVWYEIEDVTLHDWNYQPDGFRLTGTYNTWIGGSATDWTPGNNDDPPLSDSSEITHDDANFVDSVHAVYRAGAGTLLNSGYHTYRAPAVVAPSGEEFTSIQAAIDSGANRVIVKPGIYEEPFYLLSGVEAIGAGADQTIVQAPAGYTAPLATAEGVSGASLARLTLNGNGENVTGFYAENGAQAVRLARAIVRDAQTGVHVTGSATDVEVVNNTIVDNVTGMVADSCAPVDVRNTIFAHHTGAALAYEGCAATRRHTYNLYWDNTTDISPDETGPGELFLDPLFLDPLTDDYRTEDISPVVDAGNPTDSAPPGTGGRVDIGYIEQGRAAFYADDDYCENCVNDGLTWQVDAFDVIQDALDAAEAYVRDVGHTSVGVGPGTYVETLIIPSHVHLLGVTTPGVGADEVTVDADGSGSAVTLNGVTDVGISGLTLTGAGGAEAAVSVRGASNAITITRNIIAYNTDGVACHERATGRVSFNTFAYNSGYAIRVAGTGAWVDAHSNILADNTGALRAEGDAQLFSDYNLLYDNAINYSATSPGDDDLVDVNPRFADGYHLQPDSPAVDAASPFADVPVGGGIRADIGYREVLAAPVTIFLGQEDLSTVIGNSGVMTVEIGLTRVLTPSDPVTATTPGSWSAVALDSPQETVSYWRTAVTPTQTGLYRFYSRAADAAGNAEPDDAWYDGAFVADSQPPAVTWLAPVSGTAMSSPLELRAQVADYVGGAFNVTRVHFEAGGQTYPAEWAAEPWDESAGEPRIFHAWVTLTNTTYTDVRAVAEDRAGNIGQSAPVVLTISSQVPADTTPPALTVASPADGAWFTATVTFSGNVTDNDSGVASVEVSVDGGYTWLPAQTSEVSGTSEVWWSLTWQSAEEEDTIFESYPVRIRAADRAGNETVDARTLGVDTQPPTPPSNVTFRDHGSGDVRPPGYHFDALALLDLTWRVPVDESGYAEALLAVDRVSDTVPTQVITDTDTAVSFHALGEWYIHLAGRDAAGNMAIRHYGPWYVGTFAASAVSFSERRQTILIDGMVDLALNEWRTDTEFLDDDETERGTQSLYATWDGSGLYLAWDGAWWSVAGSQWTYVDVQSGGTTQPVAPITDVLETLPIAADYAVRVSSPTSGTLWAWSGGVWQEQSAASWQFALGETGGTEIYLPMDTGLVNSMQILALAEEDGAPPDGGGPWSVFPTTNRLVEPWSDAFQWGALSGIDIPNDNQPWFDYVDMAVNYWADYRDFGSPGGDVAYLINLVNLENHPVENLRLLLEASTGMFYKAVDADDCFNCPTGGDVWEVGVTTLEAGDSRLITVTGQLSATPGALTAITNLVTLSSTTPTSLTLAQGPITFRVDGLPPTVAFQMPPGGVVGAGVQTLFGIATDGPGSGAGVALVEYRVNGGPWQTATGQEVWAAPLDVLTGTMGITVEVRATDILSQTGEPISITLGVDTIPPTLTMGLLNVLTGDYGNVGGVVSDTTPLGGGLVEQVAVQIDGAGDWLPAQVYPPGSPQGWNLPWQLPLDDGLLHTLCISVTDLVGNVLSPNPCYDVFVDAVAPLLSVTQAVSRVALLDSLVVLSGTVADGNGVAGLDVWVYNPVGQAYTEVTAIVGGWWTFVPQYTELVTGDYALWVEATDVAGNSAVQGPFIVNVTEQTIAGLAAIATPNPALVGYPTTLSASVASGSNITYTWDFGDGQQSAPNLFSTAVHTYSAVGSYTAVVTAANSVGQMTAKVVVEVSNVIATNDGPTTLGEDTQLIVTTSEIVATACTWGFGDGTSGSCVLPPTPIASIQHVYPQASRYTATVTVTAYTTSYLVTRPYTATTAVIVDEPITGLVAVNDSPTRLGDATVFTATVVSGTHVIYTWSFGDVSLYPGENKEGSPITHTYLLPGVYTATVTARNGVSVVVASTLVVVDQTIAGLNAANDGPTPLNDATTLAAVVTAGSNVAYTWNLGDGGGLLPGQIVMYTYPATGTYTAVVTAANSVSSDVAATIVVVDQAITGLSAVDDGPTVLTDATAFTATIATGSRVAYTWAFGDGEFGSGAAVTHTYVSAGTYIAIVTASNSVGAVIATTAVDVDAPIAGPLAFNDGPTPLGAPTTLSATVGAGSHAAYAWAFGDGDVGSGVLVTHTYPATGTYTAVVTAANSLSLVTATTTITVDQAITDLVALADGPTPLGDATHFMATVGAGSRVAYTWALGNGATGSGAAIAYTYPTTGTYTAVVTAANSVSAITATAVVTVDEVIAGLVAFNDGPTGFGNATTLTATVGAGSRVAYTWDLGDGAIGGGAIVIHTYPAVMTYTAVVTVYNSVSSAVTTTTVVITNHAPVISPIGPQQVTEDELLSFTVVATDPEGTTPALSASGVPTGASFILTTGKFEWTPDYDAAGVYTVTFSASDGHLTDTKAITITVADLNRWPVLDPIGDRWVIETGMLTFTVSASDPDGITPTLSASGMPTGASFITQTGAFSWIPGYGAAGVYIITFRAFNGELADFETIAVTVTGVCTAVESVSISGPTSTLSGTAITLTAAYLPTDATGVTLEWDDGTTGPSATYMWPAGVYTVVTAAAVCGDPVTATHSVTVISSRRVYLPVVMRSYAGP